MVCIKSYDYVKHFVRVLVLLVINTGCLKKFLKNGEHYVLISSSIYAKRHINVCLGGDLCSPFFSNFSETPVFILGYLSLMKPIHGCKDFPHLINEDRFPGGGRFHFLLSS